MNRSLPWPRLETLAIALIALHSYVIGVFLLFFTEWGIRVGGLGEVTPLFFAQQAGAFHLVVATGYLLEYGQHRSIGLLLVAKTAAVLFLSSMIVAGNGSWTVWISLVGDVAMAVAIVVLHKLARWSRSSDAA